MPQPSITEICLKITYLKFHSNFRGANELKPQQSIHVMSGSLDPAPIGLIMYCNCRIINISITGTMKTLVRVLHVQIFLQKSKSVNSSREARKVNARSDSSEEEEESDQEDRRKSVRRKVSGWPCNQSFVDQFVVRISYGFISSSNVVETTLLRSSNSD